MLKSGFWVVKYRIYIDEAGNSDLGSSDNPNHRFLSLSGIIIALDHVDKFIFPELESLKAQFFRHHPDDPVILHRKELINRKPPFEALQDDNVRFRFDEMLLCCLKRWEYSVVSVCLDKKMHKETYQVWRYDPYHYCLAMLLDDTFSFLTASRATVMYWLNRVGEKKTSDLKSRLNDYGNQERILWILSDSKPD